MRALPTVIFVALIPFAAQADNANIEDVIEQAKSPIELGEGLEGYLELARCQGKKCAGPGDKIKNEYDVPGTQQLAGDRGGESTAGGKKGRRHHDEQIGKPVYLS